MFIVYLLLLIENVSLRRFNDTSSVIKVVVDNSTLILKCSGIEKKNLFVLPQFSINVFEHNFCSKSQLFHFSKRLKIWVNQ